MYTKQMVILAKSVKHGGWCIAGREILLDTQQNQFEITGGWIRPVSDDLSTHGALTDEHCRYLNGATPRVYDIVEVDFLGTQTESGQPENMLIAGTPWRKLSKIDPRGIGGFNETPSSIWNECVGVDYVTESYVANGNVASSLVIIKPSQFIIELSNNFNTFKNRWIKGLRASFEYAGVQYNNITITDPAMKKMYSRQFPTEGEGPIHKTLLAGDDCYLCLSLGPAFPENHNRHHKLVATVLGFDGYMQERYG